MHDTGIIPGWQSRDALLVGSRSGGGEDSDDEGEGDGNNDTNAIMTAARAKIQHPIEADSIEEMRPKNHMYSIMPSGWTKKAGR